MKLFMVKKVEIKQFNIWLTEEDPKFSSGEVGGGGYREHIVQPNVSDNCMEMKKI